MMLDYLLEEPCEDYRTSVWSMEWLKHEYNQLFVQPMMQSATVQDEIMAGFSAMKLEDDIWEGYEKWAEEYILNMEPDDEGD